MFPRVFQFIELAFGGFVAVGAEYLGSGVGRYDAIGDLYT